MIGLAETHSFIGQAKYHTTNTEDRNTDIICNTNVGAMRKFVIAFESVLVIEEVVSSSSVNNNTRSSVSSRCGLVAMTKDGNSCIGGRTQATRIIG
jgi:hypothetical protein